MTKVKCETISNRKGVAFQIGNSGVDLIVVDDEIVHLRDFGRQDDEINLNEAVLESEVKRLYEQVDEPSSAIALLRLLYYATQFEDIRRFVAVDFPENESQEDWETLRALFSEERFGCLVDLNNRGNTDAGNEFMQNAIKRFKLERRDNFRVLTTTFVESVLRVLDEEPVMKSALRAKGGAGVRAWWVESVLRKHFDPVDIGVLVALREEWREFYGNIRAFGPKPFGDPITGTMTIHLRFSRSGFRGNNISAPLGVSTK